MIIERSNWFHFGYQKYPDRELDKTFYKYSICLGFIVIYIM